MLNDYPRLVIVSGLSGAGKTQAARCLEDLGFFCVDNLPPSLIPGLVDLLGKTVKRDEGIDKLALVMDIRGGQFFAGLDSALNYLDSRGMAYEILFLEATDEVLVRRYKESRRQHPLSSGGRVLESIVKERTLLAGLRGQASKIIETSELTPRQLKEQISELFGDSHRRLMINIISFGYKYGIPMDADLVMDVRFLPNPYYIPSLRAFSGHDRCVADFVLNSRETQKFIKEFTALLRFLIPRYLQEGKSYLVIAIGCTGGQHRSVAIANKLAVLLRGDIDDTNEVIVRHRDVVPAPVFSQDK